MREQVNHETSSPPSAALTDLALVALRRIGIQPGSGIPMPSTQPHLAVSRRRRHPRIKSGDRFGRLVVVERLVGTERPSWLCRCSCGDKKTIPAECLTRAKRPTRSCGCLQRELAANRRRPRGHCGHGWAPPQEYGGRIPLLDQHQDAMHESEEDRLEALRWRGGHGLRAMVAVVPELPCGHGSETESAAQHRPIPEPVWQLRTDELPMGYRQRAARKPTPALQDKRGRLHGRSKKPQEIPGQDHHRRRVPEPRDVRRRPKKRP